MRNARDALKSYAFTRCTLQVARWRAPNGRTTRNPQSEPVTRSFSGPTARFAARSCGYVIAQRLGRGGHRLIHRGEELVVVKWLDEIGDGPASYHFVSRGIIVCRNYDGARLGRNGLKVLFDFEATHSRHPDINHCNRHRMALGLPEKVARHH